MVSLQNAVRSSDCNPGMASDLEFEEESQVVDENSVYYDLFG